MNVFLFFEGTDQGVVDRLANVTLLCNACVADEWQMLHLESGFGAYCGAYIVGKIVGADWCALFRFVRRWQESVYKSLPSDSVSINVFIFVFSGGVLLTMAYSGMARQAWYCRRLPRVVERRRLHDWARGGGVVSGKCQKTWHTVLRDETWRFFQYVPLRSERRGVADVSFAWITAGAKWQGLWISWIKKVELSKWRRRWMLRCMTSMGKLEPMGLIRPCEARPKRPQAPSYLVPPHPNN